MAVSAVINRMGSGWDELSGRVEAARSSIDGWSFDRVGEALLAGVSPAHWSHVIYALARRGVVWIGKVDGAFRVYGSKPDGVSRSLPLNRLDELAGRIAPFASVIASSFKRIGAASADAAAIERGLQFEATRRIVLICERAVYDGVPLQLIRVTLAEVFSPRIVAVVIRNAPALAVDSDLEQLGIRRPLRNGERDKTLSINERVYSEIERLGENGTTKTDLFRTVKPAPCKEELAEALAHLVEMKMVVGTMKVGLKGKRRAMHYSAER